MLPPWPAWTRQAPAEASTTIRVYDDRPSQGAYQVIHGSVTWESSSADQVAAYIVWATNDGAVQHLRRRNLLFHGGAVARNGYGLILPAASRSGKTTLVAGLLAAGFEYFSDDVVVLDRDTNRLLPFAKSLSIKAGGRQRLMSLYPQLADGSVPRVLAADEEVWYLAPAAATLPQADVAVHYVVLPTYAAGAATVLEPISRSAALECLLEQSFNLGALGAEGMRKTLELLRGAHCYKLTIGDLDPAVAALTDLITASPRTRANGRAREVLRRAAANQRTGGSPP